MNGSVIRLQLFFALPFRLSQIRFGISCLKVLSVRKVGAIGRIFIEKTGVLDITTVASINFRRYYSHSKPGGPLSQDTHTSSGLSIYGLGEGFSPRNVKYMRYFAEHCPNSQFGQQPADQLPWFHIVTLLTKAHPPEREWYATQCFAAVKTASSPNTPSTASTSPSVLRSSISYAISRFPWPRTCPASSKSKPSWPMKLCQTTTNRKPTMNKPIQERMPRHASEPHAQFAEPAMLEQAIQANLRGLHYGA